MNDDTRLCSCRAESVPRQSHRSLQGVQLVAATMPSSVGIRSRSVRLSICGTAWPTRSRYCARRSSTRSPSSSSPDPTPAVTASSSTMTPARSRCSKTVCRARCADGSPTRSAGKISPDWSGLSSKLRNAGFDVVGLDETNIGELVRSVRGGRTDQRAGLVRLHVEGRCTACRSHRTVLEASNVSSVSGGRLIAQYRIRAALARAGCAPYPEATAATGSARTTQAPLEIDPLEIAITDCDYAAAIDTVIVAHRDQSAAQPPCPICGRRPAKGGLVHVACRRRLAHAVLERPFLKSRNAAFQAGLCTVCSPGRSSRPGSCARTAPSSSMSASRCERAMTNDVTGISLRLVLPTHRRSRPPRPATRWDRDLRAVRRRRRRPCSGLSRLPAVRARLTRSRLFDTHPRDARVALRKGGMITP